jgi:hypothetical protein
MNKKQISMIVSAIIAIAGAFGIGGYSIAPGNDVKAEQIKTLSDRVSKIETQVTNNGKGIARIEGFLKAKE